MGKSGQSSDPLQKGTPDSIHAAENLIEVRSRHYLPPTLGKLPGCRNACVVHFTCVGLS